MRSSIVGVRVVVLVVVAGGRVGVTEVLVV